MNRQKLKVSRRDVLRLSMMSGAATLLGARRAFGCVDTFPFINDIELANTGIGESGEAFPTSPFILEPFNDPLPIPTAMKPGYRQPDGTLTPNALDAWTVRTSQFGPGVVSPG